MSHGNARLTFHGRLLIVQRHQARWRHAHIAAAMGISRKCVRTWIDRYAAEGEAGLHDRSSRPHTMPTQTSEEVEQRVVALRRRERRGPEWISVELGVPARTVSRILRRHHVPHLAACDPITGEVIRASKATAVPYERDRPGELVHMDVKKIGRIPDGGRALGLDIEVQQLQALGLGGAFCGPAASAGRELERGQQMRGRPASQRLAGPGACRADRGDVGVPALARRQPAVVQELVVSALPVPNRVADAAGTTSLSLRCLPVTFDSAAR